MAFCLTFCKYVALFGMIFYITMGIIVATQVEYLKFEPHNQTDSVVSCFITAALQLLIFIALLCCECRQESSQISRPQYLQLDQQRQGRARESSLKGIDLVNMSSVRQQRQA